MFSPNEKLNSWQLKIKFRYSPEKKLFKKLNKFMKTILKNWNNYNRWIVGRNALEGY